MQMKANTIPANEMGEHNNNSNNNIRRTPHKMQTLCKCNPVKTHTHTHTRFIVCNEYVMQGSYNGVGVCVRVCTRITERHNFAT